MSTPLTLVHSGIFVDPGATEYLSRRPWPTFQKDSVFIPGDSCVMGRQPEKPTISSVNLRPYTV